jgi:hypothetical protein
VPIPAPSNEPLEPSNEPVPVVDHVDSPETDGPQKGKPVLGVLVHTLGDGSVSVHGLAPDGTEHQIHVNENAGSWIAFKEAILGWFDRLGDRATSHEVTAPVKVTDGPTPAEPVEPAPEEAPLYPVVKEERPVVH